MTVCKYLSSQRLKRGFSVFISLTLVPCVAKLPRLMQAGHPQQIFPEQLADAGENLSGTLTIESMGRLAGLLASKEGKVDYSLDFARHEQGWVRIDGQFSSRLSMSCQRCLKPVDVEISHEIKVAVVSDDKAAVSIPGEFEPLLVADRSLLLNEFIEEELLLALPLAPSHDTESCHSAELEEEQSEMEKVNPFAVLKDLKLSK